MRTGSKNFQFLFSTPDAATFTRNTVLYNLAFMILSVVVGVTIAISLAELWHRRLSKLCQTTMLLPYFLSWVVAAYLVYALIDPTPGTGVAQNGVGMINTILTSLHLISTPIPWYLDPKYWPYIIIIANVWKTAGYSCILYISALAGLDQELYEAASIDGASKWRQIWNITLPLLRPMMVILTLLALGGIFRSNFEERKKMENTAKMKKRAKKPEHVSHINAISFPTNVILLVIFGIASQPAVRHPAAHHTRLLPNHQRLDYDTRLQHHPPCLFESWCCCRPSTGSGSS